jgi:hypothetical protein
MHPMFKELFIATDADDLATEQDRRHRMHRSRRARPAVIVTPASTPIADSTVIGAACCLA